LKVYTQKTAKKERRYLKISVNFSGIGIVEIEGSPARLAPTQQCEALIAAAQALKLFVKN
jgi:hypothetical protein